MFIHTRKIVAFLVLTGLIPCLCFSQTKNPINIIGNIKNVKKNTPFYLIVTTPDNNADTLAITLAKKNGFEFRNFVGDPGRIYFIKADSDYVAGNRSRYLATDFIYESKNITIEGDFNKWPLVKVSGSPASDMYKKFWVDIEPYKDAVNKSIGDTIKSSIANKEIHDFVYKRLTNETSSYSTPLLLTLAPIFTTAELQTLYNKLEDSIQRSYYGKSLFVKTQISIGATFPDFSFFKADGQVTSMQKMIKGSKITLVDFWASWCVPCREEIPYLKEAYKKYSKNGFNIVSIAVKDDSKSWKKALADENTPWINGIEQSGGEIWSLFGFNSIPAYALLDENGKILAFQWNGFRSIGYPIRQEYLLNKLSELFSESANNKEGD